MSHRLDAQRNEVTGAPVAGDKNEVLNGASELTAGLGERRCMGLDELNAIAEGVGSEGAIKTLHWL
jgi:hypothetical protein